MFSWVILFFFLFKAKLGYNPAYTISGRFNLPSDDVVPGPGAYCPEKVEAPCVH